MIFIFCLICLLGQLTPTQHGQLYLTCLQANKVLFVYCFWHLKGFTLINHNLWVNLMLTTDVIKGKRPLRRNQVYSMAVYHQNKIISVFVIPMIVLVV